MGLYTVTRDRAETIGPPSKATGRRAFLLQTGIRGFFGKLCVCSKKSRGRSQQAEGKSLDQEERKNKCAPQGTKSCQCSEPPTDVCFSCVGGNQDFCLI